MKISDYQSIAQQSIQNGQDRKELYGEIDDINNANFAMPASLQALSWIRNRKFVSIAPKIAIQGAIRTFASQLPLISVDPYGGSVEDWDKADRMERGIEWIFDQMNRAGEQSSFWKIVESSALYCAVAFQTEYLPHSLRDKKGPKFDELRKGCPLSFAVHHPGTVFPHWGRHGLENVLLANIRTVQDIVNEFGMANPGVVKLFEKIRLGNYASDLRKLSVQFYDYTDYEDRVIWVTLSGESKTFSNIIGEACVLLKEKHEMGFINWVVVDNKEPILKGLVQGQIWKNANILNTIQQSMFIALAAHPRYWTNSPSGNGVQVNYENAGNSLDLKPGETAGVLQSPDIDPGLAAAVESMERQIYEASAPRVNAESMAGKGAAFSTINALVQLSVAQLSLSKKTAEQALEAGIYQMFKWMKLSGKPLKSRLSRLRKGEDPRLFLSVGTLPVNAAPYEMAVEVDDLFIRVDLQSQTLIDEAGRINNAIQKYEKLGISQATAMEEIGIDHPDREQAARLAEEARGVMGQATKGRPGNFPAAEGIDTSKGGVSAQQYSPFQTREQITGTTKRGDVVA